MSSLSATFLVAIVLVNLIQEVHLRKRNSRFCGPTITKDGLMFHESDQIILPNQQNNVENFSLVQFAFKTTAAEGLLLLVTDSESKAFQSLELSDGKLVFRLNLGSGSSIIISNKQYDDGKWHDLDARKTVEHFDLMIDGIVVSTTSVPENFNKLYDDSVIYIGDFKETLLQNVTLKGFNGFIRNIRLGNVALDLNSLLRKNSCHKRRRREAIENNCYAGEKFEATYTGSTNVELSWGLTNCCTEYVVHSKELGAESDVLFEYSANISISNYSTKDHHIEIKYLKPSTRYEFTLSKKAAVNVTTGQSDSLIVDEVTETSIAISWELSDTFPDLELTVSNRTENLTGKTNHIISDLEPGTKYEVKLSTANNDTWNITRVIKTRGVFLDNFKCNHGSSKGDIDCSWGTESGNDCDVNYQLNFSDPFNASKHFLLNSSIYSANSFRFRSKLQPGQKYSVSIQYFAANYSSKIVNTTAIAKTGIPEHIFEKIANCSNHSITLASKLNYTCGSTSLVIEYIIINRANESYYLSSNNSVAFGNLTAGHRYQLTAVAVSNGVKSEPLQAEVSTVPNPPSMVECIIKLNTSLTVRISPPESGSFDRYKIFVNERQIPDAVIKEQKEASKIVDGATITILTGMEAFTNYTIQVQYVMNFMNLTSAPQSEILHCKTAEGIPGPVHDINFTTLETYYANVVWEPPKSPKGIIIKYEVRVVKAHDPFKGSEICNHNTEDTKMKIESYDFESGQTYTVKIAAWNSAGRSTVESKHFTLKQATEKWLIVSLLFLALLIIVLIGLLAYYFIRKSPSRMQSVRHLSSRLFNPNNEIKYFKQPSVSSKPVKISDFEAYVERLEKDSRLLVTEEYEDLKFVGRNQSHDEAELQCNRVKNRFTNILPYDISRVKLLATEDEEGSDYINASWIPGFHSKREFIACQGPLPSTMNDFWRMIWENNCQAVVMLTLCMEKGHTKCEQYWPVHTEPVFYGDVKLEMQHEEKDDEWHAREFKISMGAQSRKLIHFHYLTWPDMYVPERMSLIKFVREIRATLNKINGKGPIVVHCSAGVGRSGTFIALDTLLCQILADHDLDVYGVVFQMRLNRLLMVQTEAQYTFIYESLKQILEEKNEQSEMKNSTQEDAKAEDCKEEVKTETAESDPNSDSKEKQSEIKKEATESNLNSNSIEKENAKEPERSAEEAKETSNSDKELKSCPDENSTKTEANSNLNFDKS